jgi:hypothetical protein
MVVRFEYDSTNQFYKWWNPTHSSSSGTPNFATGDMTGTYTLDSPNADHMDNITMAAVVSENSGLTAADLSSHVIRTPRIHSFNTCSTTHMDIEVNLKSLGRKFKSLLGELFCKTQSRVDPSHHRGSRDRVIN